jgi:hypothetical protein
MARHLFPYGTHHAYLYCLQRAKLACRNGNQTAALFWGRAACQLGEWLDFD